MAEPTDEAPRRRPVSLRANAITGVILVLGFAAIIWLVSTQLSQVTVGSTVDSTVAAPDLIDLGPTFTPLPTSGVTPTASGSEPQFFDRVVLQIAVEQRTWMRVTTDGVVTFEGQVKAGDALQYLGSQSIVVLAGNAAALNVNYNGQEVGVLGERGEVIQREFTASGQVLAPTPTVTVTPTNTAVPSPTPPVTATRQN
ncbi:MAG: DUF4115 domain-containing protein [Anaerolineae bacterium]|nr:DUF4115 domain-containing protein [Anaerolineae bacterium]